MKELKIITAIKLYIRYYTIDSIIFDAGPGYYINLVQNDTWNFQLFYLFGYLCLTIIVIDDIENWSPFRLITLLIINCRKLLIYQPFYFMLILQPGTGQWKFGNRYNMKKCVKTSCYNKIIKQLLTSNKLLKCDLVTSLSILTIQNYQNLVQISISKFNQCQTVEIKTKHKSKV